MNLVKVGLDGIIIICEFYANAKTVIKIYKNFRVYDCVRMFEDPGRTHYDIFKTTFLY